MTTDGRLVGLAKQNVVAEIAPGMGAVVTRLSIDGQELLHIDEEGWKAATERAPRRGGVPVLFPSPGRLKNDMFEIDGRYGALLNHGFARDLPFTVLDRDEASITVTMEASDATLSKYPWDFRITMKVGLTERGLRYDVTLTNQDDEWMPCAFGLHPYFAVADKTKVRAITSAKRALDNHAKRTVDVPQPIDFSAGEIDLHLLDHEEQHLDLENGEGRIRVAASNEHRTWVLWTIPDGPFVCVEPWTSPANALNTKTDLLKLSPGESRELWVTIEKV
jgi:galactose mutarotase-like enzyme